LHNQSQATATSQLGKYEAAYCYEGWHTCRLSAVTKSKIGKENMEQDSTQEEKRSRKCIAKCALCAHEKIHWSSLEANLRTLWRTSAQK